MIVKTKTKASPNRPLSPKPSGITKQLDTKRNPTTNPLFLKEITQTIPHAAATTAVTMAVAAPAVPRRTVVALMVVLLGRVLRNASRDGTADSPQKAVVGLATGETASQTACNGSSEPALTTLLRFAGGVLVV